MNSSYLYSLQGCVSSLTVSVNLLESSISSLNSGVNDLPRMKKVLVADRVFEVVPESEVRSMKTTVVEEIEPQIIELLKKGEAAISKLERRHKNLVAKAELQEVRLQRRQPDRSVTKKTIGNGGEEVDLRQWRSLQQKKERLEYTLSRLNLTIDQKQRQVHALGP
ncbi:DASH complex subunit Spc19 [Dipodascopsis uninucleata]